MLSIYKTIDSRMVEQNEISEGCWINMVKPTDSEIDVVAGQLNIERSFLLSALDEEETSRIEAEDGQVLIIVDAPSAEKDGAVTYSTLPLGIVVAGDCMVTVCLKEVSPVQEVADGLVRGINTSHRTQFILTLLLRVATRYLQYLRQIEKISSYVERQLYKSQKNKELIQLLVLEKSLVYFTTSLKANEGTLEKLSRGRVIKLYEDDQDLLEDVLIEFHQAIEMANIYSSILSGTMDAFASVISNNLNVTMKVLTSITILITVPNIVFSFYGMNVGFEHFLPFNSAWFPGAVSLAVMGMLFVLLKRKGLL